MSNLFNNSNASCTLCNDVVNIIDLEMHIANSSISIIENIVSVFCHSLIIPIAEKECNFILDNMQTIINYLIERLTPKSVCKKIGLCK